MTANFFDAKALGEIVAKTLGLVAGEDVEIKKDRSNPMRVLVLRHSKQESQRERAV